MPDLLDKLNVLVRASLNSVLSGDNTNANNPARRIPADRLGKDIDREIAALRGHIDDALNAEDAMQTRLDAANAQIDTLDRQADHALLDGDDANARYLVQQLQRQRQQAAMQSAGLEDHRRATSELIERVNTLEAMVSDARRTQAEQPTPAVPSESSVPLSNMLRDAREGIDQPLTEAAPPGRSVPITIHRDSVPASTPPSNAANTATSPDAPDVKDQIKVVVDQAKVEDDLAARRARLSKPD